MDIAGWMDQTDGTLLSLHKSFNMRALCPASSIVEKKREKGRRTGPRLENVGCVVACPCNRLSFITTRHQRRVFLSRLTGRRTRRGGRTFKRKRERYRFEYDVKAD